MVDEADSQHTTHIDVSEYLELGDSVEVPFSQDEVDAISAAVDEQAPLVSLAEHEIGDGIITRSVSDFGFPWGESLLAREDAIARIEKAFARWYVLSEFTPLNLENVHWMVLGNSVIKIREALIPLIITEERAVELIVKEVKSQATDLHLKSVGRARFYGSLKTRCDGLSQGGEPHSLDVQVAQRLLKENGNEISLISEAQPMAWKKYWNEGIVSQNRRRVAVNEGYRFALFFSKWKEHQNF